MADHALEHQQGLEGRVELQLVLDFVENADLAGVVPLEVFFDGQRKGLELEAADGLSGKIEAEPAVARSPEGEGGVGVEVVGNVLERVEVRLGCAEAEKEGDHVGAGDEDGAVGDVLGAELHDFGDCAVVGGFEDLFGYVQLGTDVRGGGGCR